MKSTANAKTASANVTISATGALATAIQHIATMRGQTPEAYARETLARSVAVTLDDGAHFEEPNGMNEETYARLVA
ncbi:MAG: hypothetical protein H2172_00765 [Opitutus sp.]|nr:hypothetical protein [Opitutus sp.]MCS6246252.1 hypothetical protein [Opitutus sp.]MCS6274117.1 hypothetical protein [Opitutus sp.]MCS6277259.1 hypothetical protein [Opitutus sp.]MCS6300381.1 hypothetical protein [Opitutus sp.]